MDLTEAFYQTIPYDFGMKKPVSIDQLIRVKQKAKAISIANDICLTEQVLKDIMVSITLQLYQSIFLMLFFDFVGRH